MTPKDRGGLTEAGWNLVLIFSGKVTDREVIWTGYILEQQTEIRLVLCAWNDIQFRHISTTTHSRYVVVLKWCDFGGTVSNGEGYMWVYLNSRNIYFNC